MLQLTMNEVVLTIDNVQTAKAISVTVASPLWKFKTWLFRQEINIDFVIKHDPWEGLRGGSSCQL